MAGMSRHGLQHVGGRGGGMTVPIEDTSISAQVHYNNGYRYERDVLWKKNWLAPTSGLGGGRHSLPLAGRAKPVANIAETESHPQCFSLCALNVCAPSPTSTECGWEQPATGGVDRTDHNGGSRARRTPSRVSSPRKTHVTHAFRRYGHIRHRHRTVRIITSGQS